MNNFNNFGYLGDLEAVSLISCCRGLGAASIPQSRYRIPALLDLEPLTPTPRVRPLRYIREHLWVIVLDSRQPAISQVSRQQVQLTNT